MEALDNRERGFIAFGFGVETQTKERSVSFGTVFYGTTVGAPTLPDYGIAINVKYYGIFTRKQAQKRIRKLNRQINRRSRKLSGMRTDMFAAVRTPQTFLNSAGFQMKQIRTLRNIRNTIAKRWNLKRSGRKKKGGGRFLFWKKRR
jgi:hypothetical protein|tara:strand:- start:7645 stop:8082 length:438 start_codon:yes stop_codon:yes gene_type:complete